MVDALRRAGVGPDGIHLISDLKRYAGASQRSGDVFSNRSFFAMASNTVRRGIGGVDNIYTQHEPLLVYTLDDLLRGRLKTVSYPSASDEKDVTSDSILGGGGSGIGSRGGTAGSGGNSGAASSSSSFPFISPPREVIVVIAGGVTLEESKCVSGINGGPNTFRPPEGSTTASAAAAAKQIGARIVIGGSNLSNSSAFAIEVTRSIASRKEAHFSLDKRCY
jgi:Sec1 family